MPPAHTQPPDDSGDETGFGNWGAAIAILALVGLIAVPIAGPVNTEELPAEPDRAPAMLAALAPAEEAIESLASAFARLCREPVLFAVDLEPDCETGVMTIGDDRFEEYGSPNLRAVAQEDLRAAMRIYLDRLRSTPALWESLEAIEIRGHSDPRALRDAYATNLVGSQQRPLGVLLFLVGPKGVSDDDRKDLERLAIVSGASYSRPPASCPEEQRECYADWRRVEIRPVLSERIRRAEWSHSIEAVRQSALPRDRAPAAG
jgi:flagellar motor protein MotB